MPCTRYFTVHVRCVKSIDGRLQVYSKIRAWKYIRPQARPSTYQVLPLSREKAAPFQHSVDWKASTTCTCRHVASREGHTHILSWSTKFCITPVARTWFRCARLECHWALDIYSTRAPRALDVEIYPNTPTLHSQGDLNPVWPHCRPHVGYSDNNAHAAHRSWLHYVVAPTSTQCHRMLYSEQSCIVRCKGNSAIAPPLRVARTRRPHVVWCAHS